MHVAYSSDELKSLVRILNDILAQARTSRPDLARDDVVERVFSLADRGERDPHKLRQAVFGASTNGAPHIKLRPEFPEITACLQKATAKALDWSGDRGSRLWCQAR